MGTGRNDLKLFPNVGDPTEIAVAQTDPYLAEITYWIDCIATGQPATRATPADARTALKTAIAARRSLDSAGLVAVSV